MILKRPALFFITLRLTGLFLFSAKTSTAQLRKYSNEFMNIGVGARALGMGGSVIALSNDVSAGYWNPAGLTGIKPKVQGNLMHANYFAGIAVYDYAAVAAPIDNASTLSASIIRFGIDDIKDTSELKDKDGNENYDRIKTFSAADYAFLISYARRKQEDAGDKTLSYGASAKIIHRRIGSFARSWGFGIDAGATYQVKKWAFALMAKDITTTFNAWSYNISPAFEQVLRETGNNVPATALELTLPQLSTGISFSTPINAKFGLSTELDIIINTDGPRNVLISYHKVPFSFDPRLGLELDYKKTVFIRSGLSHLQKFTTFEGKKTYQIQPAIGAGLRIKSLYLDYALTNISYGEGIFYSNVFSLRLDIGNSNQE